MRLILEVILAVQVILIQQRVEKLNIQNQENLDGYKMMEVFGLKIGQD